MNLSRIQEMLRLGTPIEAAIDANLMWKGSSTQKTSSNSTSEQTQNQNNTGTTTTSPNQSAQYNNLLGQADTWLSQGGTSNYYGGAASGSTVPLSNEQLGSIYSSVNNGNELNGIYTTAGREALWQMLGNYDPNNTGLSSAIDASNNRLDWNYNTTVAPQVTQGAIDTGQYGSTRNGVAQGIALSNMAQQKQDAASTLAYQDQQAFNSNRLAAYQSLGQITSGINSGNDLANNSWNTIRQVDQDTNDRAADYQNQKWLYENGASLSDLTAYKNLISGDMGGTTNAVSNSSGTASGTSNSTGTNSGGSGSGLGSILSNVGGMFAGSYAGAAGSKAGSSGSLFGGLFG